jgi:hypothetical protein
MGGSGLRAQWGVGKVHLPRMKSQPVRFINRYTGAVETEPVPGEGWLRWLSWHTLSETPENQQNGTTPDSASASIVADRASCANCGALPRTLAFESVRRFGALRHEAAHRHAAEV